MATFHWRTLLAYFILIQLIQSAITVVRPDGEQESASSTSEAKAKKVNKPKKPQKLKTPHSQYNIMWVTPLEIFNLSTVEDHVIYPSINNVMSEYAQYLYNRFTKGLNDGTIKLNGIDDKASLNDKFFALQQYLHETNNFHRSSAVPKKEFMSLKLHIRNLVNIYLKRCGVDQEIIKKALLSIEIDEKQQSESAEERMFLWATMLSNGSYHAPHSHQDSIVSGVYFAKIPTERIDENGEDDTGGYLVFGDPRGGGIYPFGLKYIHIPIEGQIVLFPGYLTHWVEPVKSADMRISFSFNIPGSWDDLSDTSLIHNF